MSADLDDNLAHVSALLEMREGVAGLGKRENTVDHRLQPRPFDNTQQLLQSGAVADGDVAEGGGTELQAEEVDTGIAVGQETD